jgi:hypothetical protein
MAEIFFLLYISQLAAGMDAGHWASVGMRGRVQAFAKYTHVEVI